MKFIYKIISGLSVLMLIFIALWGIFFFRAMEEEVNDETDDMLEDFSADIIMKWLAGVEIPSADNGSNNTYYIRSVTPEFAASVPSITYENSMIYIVRQREQEPARIRRQVFLDADNEWHELTVAVPTFERRDLMARILRWTVILYVVLSVSGIAITAAVVSYNFRPLKALLKWLDSYVPGQKSGPVPCDTDIIEFRTIARATQMAADRADMLYEQQNQFIGNASHELQTPLAVCSGRIEMLLDSDTLTEHQAEELAKVNRTLGEMSRMNRTLLLLTKIDNGQFIDSVEMDLCGVIREKAEMFDEIYHADDIRSDVRTEGELRVRMNEQLASVLVSNLLKNAFIHSRPGGKVCIIARETGFEVSNDGEAPLDGARIFERFYQGGGKKTGTSGLGLALVKSICDRYSFGISYEFDGKHRFVVRCRGFSI